MAKTPWSELKNSPWNWNEVDCCTLCGVSKNSVDGDGDHLHVLENVLDFSGFNWAKWYESEQDILKPQLEKMGYNSIRFSTGESDSFGPLTRVVTVSDSSTTTQFIYG